MLSDLPSSGLKVSAATSDVDHSGQRNAHDPHCTRMEGSPLLEALQLVKSQTPQPLSCGGKPPHQLKEGHPLGLRYQVGGSLPSCHLSRVH